MGWVFLEFGGPMYDVSSGSKMRHWVFAEYPSFFENEMRQRFLQADYYSFSEWNP